MPAALAAIARVAQDAPASTTLGVRARQTQWRCFLFARPPARPCLQHGSRSARPRRCSPVLSAVLDQHPQQTNLRAAPTTSVAVDGCPAVAPRRPPPHMASVEAAARGGSRSAQLAGLPDNVLDILAAQLGGQARLALSHTCRSLRQAGRRWFARVWVGLGDRSPQLDCAWLASWLRSHEGAHACVRLAEDSDASLLDKLTSDGSELRGLAVGHLTLWPGPAVDASRLRKLTQLTSLHIEHRRLHGRTDSLGQLVMLQRLQLIDSLASIPSSLASLTGLTHLMLTDVSFSIDSQNRILPQLMGLRSLILEECGLAAVPGAIIVLTALTGLGLGWNNLEQPECLTLLAALTQLRALHLAGNACDTPEGLSALTGLTKLVLFYTRPSLASINRALLRLVNLQQLDLARCRLAAVPTAITALTSLSYLNLHSNRWDRTRCLAPLAALAQLRHLNLGNSMCDVPRSLSTLTALTALCLNRRKSHPLYKLPLVVSALTRLEALSLRRAKLKTGWQHLRPLTRLRELDLDRNDLKELPRELTALQALEKLSLARSYPARGWQHLLALPRLQSLTASVDPPDDLYDHVEEIYIPDETGSESELSDCTSDSDA